MYDCGHNIIEIAQYREIKINWYFYVSWSLDNFGFWYQKIKAKLNSKNKKRLNLILIPDSSRFWSTRSSGFGTKKAKTQPFEKCVLNIKVIRFS